MRQDCEWINDVLRDLVRFCEDNALASLGHALESARVDAFCVNGGQMKAEQAAQRFRAGMPL